MSMHFDLAKAEIATRLHHAETRRTARLVRTRPRPGPSSRRRSHGS